MQVSLLTLGSPDTPTGGYLFHRRLAEAAPAHGAQVSFESFPEWPFPAPLAAGGRVVGRAAGADVIVVDSIVAAYAGPWLGRLRRPIVGMLHQPPGGIDHAGVRRRLQSVLDRRAYRRMRRLLVASESIAVDFRSLHPDVRVVAPGRDVAAQPETSRLDMRRGRAAAVLCVGNWVRRKGITELVDAFAILPEHLATLHLVGDTSADGAYGARVRARVERLGGRVIVHGVVSKERVAAMYRDADLFAMPSYTEPYGTVWGEAMAAGLPVVGWRAGNLPYLAEHGREALMAEPGDIAGLAAALQRLAENEGERKAMGAAARARAESFPTWDETAARFFGELRDVTGHL